MNRKRPRTVERIGQRGPGSEKLMHLQIGFAGAQIEPEAVVQHDASDAFARLDQFQKHGNDRANLPCRNVAENRGRQNINPGEEIGRFVPSSQAGPDIRDQPGLRIALHLSRPARTAQK